MPMPSSAATAGEHHGKIYVLGGGSEGLGTVQEYAPATDTWATKTSMNEPRWSTVVSVGGLVYVIGGIFDGFGSATVETYDPTKDN
jgi:hypothetical protein